MLVLVLSLAVSARAENFVVVVHEDTFEAIPGVSKTERVQKKVVTSSFLVRSAEPTTTPTQEPGSRLSSITRYQVRNHKLCDSNQEVCPAALILAQVSVRRTDVAVIARMQNQFSSPLKLVRAFVGHPIQVWDICAVEIQDGRVIRSEKLATKQEAYRLRVEVFEEPISERSAAP